MELYVGMDVSGLIYEFTLGDLSVSRLDPGKPIHIKDLRRPWATYPYRVRLLLGSPIPWRVGLA